MTLAVDEIHTLLEQAMRTINASILEKHAFTPDLTLMGAEGALDSLDTMLFLDETEELLSKRMGGSVKLVTESVFARQDSPFRTVRSLTAYIAEVLAAFEAAGL